ncbi:MAG: LPS export ABC transporter periplasmic protein LptC [Elusimicrobia bacterium]|nr:LPS export ABC transporter periplasmic protein LptC [Elusimicrobiota bacterium]
MTPLRGLAAALAVLFAACGCRRAAAPAQSTRQVLEGFTLTQTVRGRKTWQLKARSAVLEEDADRARISEPRMEFYSEDRPVSRVRSLRGTVRLDSHDVRLSSSVVLEALEERSTMRTEQLDYSSKSNLFSTESDVAVERPEGRLRGRGMQAAPDLSEIRIFNQQAVVQAAPR